MTMDLERRWEGSMEEEEREEQGGEGIGRGEGLWNGLVEKIWMGP